MLDDDIKEEFSLFAIHCSEEAYKMAFLLNSHLGLKLVRENIDLDFSNNGLEVTFPLFKFKNNLHYTTYYLVANKCKSMAANVQSSGGLFEKESSNNMITTILIPEYKKADYFLKVHSEFSSIPLRKIIASLNEIKQVISSYEIAHENIKSKTNLIFD